ncbi:DUF1624 domain-containing protein [Roseibium sp. Sym1]|uniref:DUF1624 domain-containing protein n=1 Tax=Roseibium sp. Sym1 TaxID=3016006 RepID=UPI0022B558F9|nr:heparan-alpha-glucosaminide N-acetyltransferase [Roseibium sp. Sym1]
MPTTRLAVIDLARGLAVVAMAVYHLSWDLSWFSLVDWPVAQGPGWRLFAGSIAGSFLFLAGVSLDLAHHNGIRWQAFWRRLAMIIAAAAAVSLATYFAFGSSFVRFGILHCIALSSLIALGFVRLPLWSVLAASAVFLTLPLWGASHAFDGEVWLWTGLGTPTFGSVDYVPVAPWTGVTLAGLALSRAFRVLKTWQGLSRFSFSSRIGRVTRLAGRHSLAIYLLHQPVLYGLVWIAVQASPAADRVGAAFVSNCTAACQETYDRPEMCESACGCTLERLKEDGIWTDLTAQPDNASLRNRLNTRYAQCLADPEQPPAVN